MDLMVTSDGDGLEIEYKFCRDSFVRSVVERLLGHMEWLLDRLEHVRCDRTCSSFLGAYRPLACLRQSVSDQRGNTVATVGR